MQQHETAHHVRMLIVKCPYCNAESVCSIDVALWRPGPRPQLIVQQPGVQQPVEQQPFVQQQPVVQQPLAQQLQAHLWREPDVQQPVEQQPVVQQPVVQQPVVQQPQAQQLQAQQHPPIVQQPGVQQPVVQQPQTQLQQQQQQQPQQLPQSEMDAQLLDFHRLLDEGREHDSRGDLEKALDCFKRGTAMGITALQSWPRTAPVVQQHRQKIVWAMTRSELILKALARLGRGKAAGKAPPSPQPPPVYPPPQPPLEHPLLQAALPATSAAAAEHQQLQEPGCTSKSDEPKRQPGMPRPPLGPPPKRLLALAKSKSSQSPATARKSMTRPKADCEAEAKEAPPKSMPRRRAHQTAAKEEGSPDGDQKRADSPSEDAEAESEGDIVGATATAARPTRQRGARSGGGQGGGPTRSRGIRSSRRTPQPPLISSALVVAQRMLLTAVCAEQLPTAAERLPTPPVMSGPRMLPGTLCTLVLRACSYFQNPDIRIAVVLECLVVLSAAGGPDTHPS